MKMLRFLFARRIMRKGFSDNATIAERIFEKLKCSAISSQLLFIGRLMHLMPFLGLYAELRKATLSFAISVCPSACPHGTTRLPLDGFT